MSNTSEQYERIQSAVDEYIASGRNDLMLELTNFSACSSDFRVRFNITPEKHADIAARYEIDEAQLEHIIRSALTGLIDKAHFAELQKRAFDQHRDQADRLNDMTAGMLADFWLEMCRRSKQQHLGETGTFWLAPPSNKDFKEP